MLGGGNKNVHVKYEYSEKKKKSKLFQRCFQLAKHEKENESNSKFYLKRNKTKKNCLRKNVYLVFHIQQYLGNQLTRNVLVSGEAHT